MSIETKSALAALDDEGILVIDPVTGIGGYITKTVLLNYFQGKSNNLSAISGLTTIADRMMYWTGSGTAALIQLLSWARTMLSAASMDAAGIVDKTTYQAISASKSIAKLRVGNAGTPIEIVELEGDNPNISIKNAISTGRSAIYLKKSDGDRAGFFYYDDSYATDSWRGNLHLNLDNAGSFVLRQSRLSIKKDIANYDLDVSGNVFFAGFLGSSGTTLAGFSSSGAVNGALYWITNGRKSGEGVGAGTGVWGQWDVATSTLYYADSVSTGKTAVLA